MKTLNCIECGKRAEGTTGRCASCNRIHRKLSKIELPADPEPIKKQSDIMTAMMRRYIPKAKAFVRGKKCAVLKNVPATTVHHKAGRSIDEYYDEWAQERGIPLLLDERFWLPVSLEGHIEIEKRPGWAKKQGYSEDRLIKRRQA